MGGKKGKAKRGCPVCGAPPCAGYRPFCSRRCADRDLGHWLEGAYAIPTEEAPAETAGEEDLSSADLLGRGDAGPPRRGNEG